MFGRRALKPFAWMLMLALLATIVPVSAASAQGNALTPGQAVTGTINDANYMEVWRYQSPGNETINVSVEATSGDLDTTLVIISANMDVLGINDDIDASNDNFNSAVNGLFIPNPDTIFVIVSRFDTQAGASTGSYRLLLTTGAATNIISSEPIEEPSILVLDADAIDGGMQSAFDHLIAMEVIPDWDGTIGINIPEGAFIEGSRRDTNPFLFMRLGQGYEAADVIIHSDVVWRGEDDTMACGFAFRVQNNSDGYGVYLSREGWVELGFLPKGEGADWESIGNWTVPDLNPRDGGENSVLITAVDDEFHIFVNYVLVGTATDSRLSGAGEFYMSVLKDAGVTARCDFNNYWVITQDQ